MRSWSVRRYLSHLIVAGVLLGFGGPETSAQQVERNFKTEDLALFGYSGNIPKIPLGIIFALSRPGGFGFFCDAMVNAQQDKQTGDRSRDAILVESIQRRASAHIGITAVGSYSTAVFFGVGISSSKGYCRWISGSKEMWTREGSARNRIDFTGGFLLRVNDEFGIRVGAFTQPAGASLGLFFLSPAKQKK